MENENKFMKKVIIWGVGILVAIVVAITVAPFKIVGAGERGIVLRWGAVERIMPEGLNWKMPIMERVKILDVKTQKEQVDVNSASKDLQTVSTEIALNYHLIPDKVDLLWKNIGSEYKERIIDPAIQEAVKATTAKYTAEELITKRNLVKDEIKTALTARLTADYIFVDELSITSFDFSSSFNTAIEAKVTAEQSALAAKNKLEQVKFEAEQRISQAKGEAEAIKIQAQAINSQGGADYVQLQWIRAWAEGGSKVPTFITGDKAGNFLFNLPN